MTGWEMNEALTSSGAERQAAISKQTAAAIYMFCTAVSDDPPMLLRKAC